MVKLKLKSDKSDAFWVANVHMPCKYWHNKLMAAFACNIGNAVQKQAGDNRYILAGDFNSKPPTDTEPSGVYELFTKGELNADHPHFPVVEIENEEWKPRLGHPMKSAYFVANGNEPEVTCYTNHKERGVFCNTLDYIWLSPKWKVLSVDPVMGVDEIKESVGPCGSFPCETNMSDHIKLGANLMMLMEEQQAVVSTIQKST